MTFKLPENPQFPLEVETVGDQRAWIDSDSGKAEGQCILLGRYELTTGEQNQIAWTREGRILIGAGDSLHDLKPLFTPMFPEFIPPGWWMTRDDDGEVKAGLNEPTLIDDGIFDHCAWWNVCGIEQLNWDWSRTFHPDWPWYKCKLQKPKEDV